MPRHFALWIVPAVLLVSSAASADAAAATGVEGVGVGHCGMDGKDVFVLLRFQWDGDRVAGLAYSPTLGVRTPISDAEADGNRLALSFGTSQGTVRLSCEVHGEVVEGTSEYGRSKGTCRFRRRQPMDAAAFDAI